MTSQRPLPRSARSTGARVAGWLFVVTGTGHGLLAAVSLAMPVPAGERPAHEAMAAATFSVAGLDRSLWQLFTGFSLLMALMLVGFGALNLLVLRQAPQLLHRSRALLWLDLAVLVPALVLSVLLLPPPPIVLLGAATVAVLVALSRPGTRLAEPSSAEEAVALV